MSISYNKSIPVVFLVQEGDELPREATEEDFRKAGYVPANHVVENETTAAEDVPAGTDTDKCSNPAAEPCETCCEDCLFLGKEHTLIDLLSLPEVNLDPFAKIGRMENLEDILNLGRNFKIFNLSNVPEDAANDLYDPLRAPESKVKAEPEAEEKPSLIEEVAGDLFKGAFSVFNTVKDGLADLMEPIDYSEADKATAEASSDTPESKEKPEFDEFETSVIEQFAKSGYGKEAADAMRKSKEFRAFLKTTNPTTQEALKFAKMLRDGKDNFFG